jgi:hypothetical protein
MSKAKVQEARGCDSSIDPRAKMKNTNFLIPAWPMGYTDPLFPRVHPKGSELADWLGFEDA